MGLGREFVAVSETQNKRDMDAWTMPQCCGLYIGEQSVYNSLEIAVCFSSLVNGIGLDSIY